MKHESSAKRPRGRGGQKRPSGGIRRAGNRRNASQPAVRGDPRQVFEKYTAMANDASTAGDLVAMEYYLQHAEHYYRILQGRRDNSNGATGNSGNAENPGNPGNSGNSENPSD